MLPEQNLNEANRFDHQPKAVGRVEKRGARMTVYLPVPADALPSLLTLLAANKIRCVRTHGPAPHYGRALVRSFYLSTEVDPEGYLEPAEG